MVSEIRNGTYIPMVCTVLPVAPLQGGLVQIVEILERPDCKEIILCEPDEFSAYPLVYGARLAEFCLGF